MTVPVGLCGELMIIILVEPVISDGKVSQLME